MKRRSVDVPGDPIAGTENIYAWGKDQIVKLYGKDTPPGWVEHLGQMERALHDAGLPVPGVGEIIETDDGLGQVYERIPGGTMASELLGTKLSRNTIVRLARIFAEVQVRIHTCGRIPAIPSQRRLLARIIDRTSVLPPDLKKATLEALDEMPDGDRLCHGDFHPFNVLIGPQEPMVIDWNNAHIGNPMEDVARTALMLFGLTVSEPSHRSMIDRFAPAYLERYCQLRPVDQEQLAAWQPIVAAVRLNDNIPELQGWLLEQIRTGLALRNNATHPKRKPS